MLVALVLFVIAYILSGKPEWYQLDAHPQIFASVIGLWTHKFLYNRWDDYKYWAELNAFRTAKNDSIELRAEKLSTQYGLDVGYLQALSDLKDG